MSAVPKQPAQADGITDLPRVNLQASITVSEASNKKSKDWKKVTTSLGALLTDLKGIQVGKKGDGMAWAPATFKKGRRKAEDALETHLLVLDSDAGHPLPVLRSRFEALGWHAVIIPSPSWGSDVSDVREDAFNRWAAEVRQAEGAATDATPERFLIERHDKTPAVAAGAEIIEHYAVEDEDKEGRKRLTLMLRIRHQPCEKYRIVCVLSEPFDLSTKEGRSAWTRYYDAVVDRVELPLDRSCSSPERLFFRSRLPAELIENAKNHIATVEGSPIVVADLPEPKRLDRTRRAGVGRVGVGRGGDQAGGDDGREYIWTDPDTDRVMNLKVLAAKGLFEHLELASALLDNGWPQDDRGVIDGKHHIQCPFEGEHTSPGGTIAWNASDYEKIELPELKPGAGIICPHNACKNPRGDGRKRDRLEFILEFLREGGLTTADLDKALDSAHAARLAEDFDVIEDPDGIDLRPPIERPTDWVYWERETIKAKAPFLRRLRAEKPDEFAECRIGWDTLDEITPEDLDRLCDEAPDHIPPKDDRTARRTRDVPQWHRLGKGFDPNDLPDRPWTLGARFMSGAVTAGIGAPGVSKSTFALLSAISIATGRPLTGETVHRQGRVWIHNNEDDLDEMQRRIAGVGKEYNIDYDVLDENIVFSSGEVQKLVLAKMKEGAVKDAFAIDEFIQEIKSLDVVHMVLDPFVSVHTGVPENDNAAMEDVVSIIRRIANQAAVSIDLLHHISKDNSGDSEKRAGDMNAARGASALVAAVRCAYTLSRMNKTTAPEKFSIPAEQAGQYVRLDMAKGNYSRHEGAPRWFKIQSVNIRDDASDLTALVSGAGELLEGKEGPPQPPLTVGVHVPWLPPPTRQAVEVQAGVVREDKKNGLLQIVAEAMPSDRCHVADVLDAVMKQRGVQDTAARILVKKAVLDTDAGHVVQLGDRGCTLRIVREGYATKGPLFLERDWIEPENDD